MCKKYNVNNKCNELIYYPESRWTSEKELLKEKKFKHYLFHKLKKCKEDGVVIRSQIVGKKHHVNMYGPQNTIIISNEEKLNEKRSYINSSIQILSSCANKPSFVVVDKGECYINNVRKLTEDGYEIKVLDLNNPNATARWNPMGNAFNLYQRAHNLQNEVETFKGIDPIKTKYKPIEKEYGSEWYGFDGVACKDKGLLESAIRAKKLTLLDMVEKELRQISTAICPTSNDSEKNLEIIAQNFIYGAMLAMLENAMSGEQGMSRDKFNLYNVAKICMFEDGNYSTLKNYFANFDTTSKVCSLVSPLINNTPDFIKSVMDVVTRSLSLFLDKNMCFATSENEINFDNLNEKPVALFIKMPQNNPSYSIIATMCIYQIYTSIFYKASSIEAIKGFRNVYLFLDDFVFLPKIDGFDICVTLGRSRKILSLLFVPSYDSVYDNYGEETGKTITSNCNIHIYFGSDAMKTKENFSRLCGDVRYNNESRPLIYPDELDGGVGGIVKILRQFPIRAKFS